MKYYYLLLLIALFCWNCQEDKLDTYDGQDGVYFINLYATRILTSDDWFSDTTNFSFALVNASDTVINLGVRVMGNMVDYDRTFRINYTTNATAGIHYDELESEYTIPANNSDSYIPIHIYREAIESDTTFYIELQLISNDNFAQNMPFKELIEDGVTDTLDITRHVLAFSNGLYEPTIWVSIDGAYVGEWTEAKFIFINEMLEINPADWYGSNASLWMDIMNKVQSGTVFITNYLNSLIAQDDYANYPKDPDNSDPADKGYLTIVGIEIPSHWPDASTTE